MDGREPQTLGRSHLRYPNDLTDEEWGHVEPLITPAKRRGNKGTVNLREVMTVELGWQLGPHPSCALCGMPGSGKARSQPDPRSEDA